MMRVADMHSIEVQVDVGENDIPKVKIGTPLKQGFSCAIGIVSVDGKKPGELDSFLFDKYKVHAVGIEWENIHGLRVTPNVYTTTKNLDVLVEKGAISPHDRRSALAS